MKREEREIKEGLKKLNSTVTVAYSKMLEYYKTFDCLRGTHHLEILHMLYECESGLNMDGIAMRCHISRSTLDRNRKEYLKCFNYYKSLDAVSEEAAFTIASV